MSKEITISMTGTRVTPINLRQAEDMAESARVLYLVWDENYISLLQTQWRLQDEEGIPRTGLLVPFFRQFCDEAYSEWRESEDWLEHFRNQEVSSTNHSDNNA